MSPTSPTLPRHEHGPALRWAPDTDCQPLSVDITFPGSPGRSAMESLVREVFRRDYGAEVTSFCDCLLGLRRGDRLLGVVGMRRSGPEPFFLQQYLDEPARTCVERHAGTACAASELVEIGNLAVVEPGAWRHLLTALAGFLHGAGARWMIFTAIAPLIHLLGRAGFQPRQVAVADRTRLAPGTDKWGAYYLRQARVCIGSIDAAADVLAAGPLYRDQAANALWDQAWSRGSAARPWRSGQA